MFFVSSASNRAVGATVTSTFAGREDAAGPENKGSTFRPSSKQRDALHVLVDRAFRFSIMAGRSGSTLADAIGRNASAPLRSGRWEQRPGRDAADIGAGAAERDLAR